MRTLLVLLSISTTIILPAQDWSPGTILLVDSTRLSGEVAIQSFGNIESVLFRRNSGAQMTIPVHKVHRVRLETKNGIVKYKKVSFLLEQEGIPPSILFEVLFESDKIALYRKNLKVVKKTITLLPVPAPTGLLLLFRLGNRLESEEGLFVANSDPLSLTLVSNERLEDYPNEESYYVNSTLIKKEFIKEDFEQLKPHIKENKLKWNRIDDLIQILEYYSKL